MKVDISSILPQRPPFVMVEDFVSYSPETVVTALTVRADNIFFEDGALSAEGLMENFAQTCAARIGYINKYILHKDVNIGYIGAVKNWELKRLPREGERILTRIDVIQEIGPMVKVRAEASADSDLLASGEMTIALSDIAVSPGAEAATSATPMPSQKTASQPLPLAATEQLVEVRGNRLTFYEVAADGSRRKVLSSPCGYGRNGFALPPAGLPFSEGCPFQGGDARTGAVPSLPIKREGDGRTPVGVFPLDLLFGTGPDPRNSRSCKDSSNSAGVFFGSNQASTDTAEPHSGDGGQSVGTVLPYRQITPFSYWSGEPDTYNNWVELPSAGNEVCKVSEKPGHLAQKRPKTCTVSQESGHLTHPDAERQSPAAGPMPASEHLADYPVQYKYAASIGYNTEKPVFGAGSAIFLHCFGPRKGISRLLHLPAWLRGLFRCADISTAGCISVPERVMLRLLRALRPGAKICITPNNNN